MRYYEDDEAPRAARANEILNKLERVYLSTIRAIALAAATLLVIYALWLAASGLYKTSRDSASVKEQPAVVSPEEVTAIDLAEPSKSEAPGTDLLAGPKRYYADFGRRYYALFRGKFEPFKKPEDKLLSQKDFGQRFVHSAERLQGIEEGKINFEQDKADLESLLTTMTAAASDQKTIDRLRTYKAAKKLKITRTETGSRQEAYCSYYGTYIDACLSYDTRTVPFSRSITAMKLPSGVISHADLFGAYQDAYLTKLAERRDANAAEAQRQREEIIAGNANGQARLWSALSVVGAFVVLMFLFLLIALERHQRKIAASVAMTE